MTRRCPRPGRSGDRNGAADRVLPLLGKTDGARGPVATGWVGTSAPGTVHGPRVAKERRASLGGPAGHARWGRCSGPAACRCSRAPHAGPCSEGMALGLHPLGRVCGWERRPSCWGPPGVAPRTGQTAVQGNLAASPSRWPERTLKTCRGHNSDSRSRGRHGDALVVGTGRGPSPQAGPPAASPPQVTASLSPKH